MPNENEKAIADVLAEMNRDAEDAFRREVKATMTEIFDTGKKIASLIDAQGKLKAKLKTLQFVPVDASAVR